MNRPFIVRKITLAAIMLTCFSILETSFSDNTEFGKPKISAGYLDEPMTVSASTVGRFYKGRSWHLDIDSAGEAKLTIRTYPKHTHRSFQISKGQFVALRNLLVQERFFELADEYGQIVSDGRTSTLTVTVGKQSKTVKLHYFGNWIKYDTSNLVEPSRALRIFILVRDWFEDPAAADMRKFDRMVLDTVTKLAPPDA